MKRVWSCLAIVALSTVLTVMSEAESPQEQTVWKLEHDYWQYVKDFDLEGYRNLWNENFVGWPESSATPVRKANIGDWFMGHKLKGDELQGLKLEPAASQEFGDSVVVTHYWITAG